MAVTGSGRYRQWQSQAVAGTDSETVAVTGSGRYRQGQSQAVAGTDSGSHRQWQVQTVVKADSGNPKQRVRILSPLARILILSMLSPDLEFIKQVRVRNRNRIRIRVLILSNKAGSVSSSRFYQYPQMVDLTNCCSAVLFIYLFIFIFIYFYFFFFFFFSLRYELN